VAKPQAQVKPIVAADLPYPFERLLNPGPNTSALPAPTWDTLVDRVLAICQKWSIGSN
jgi:hypothetical protein